MKTLEFLYQENQIHFLINPSDKNVMVNATEMGKLFFKEPKDFLRLDGTKKYIEALLKKQNIGADVPRYFKNDVVNSNYKSGTFMHRKLALKFAAWLDVEFELWVFDTIDTILFGEYEKHQKAIIETLQAEKEIEALESEMANNTTYQKIKDLKAFVKTKDTEKRNALKAKMKQIKLDFAKT